MPHSPGWRPVDWVNHREKTMGENPHPYDANFFEAGADAMLKALQPKLDAFDGLVKALEELTATGFNSKGEYEDWMFGARARGRVALAKALGKGE